MAKIDIGAILDIANAIRPALEKVAKDPKTAMQQKDVNQAANKVEAAVTTEVNKAQKEVDAVIENLENQEPWYQSRVTWGSIFTLVFSVFGIAGITIDFIEPDQAAAIAVLGGTFFGALVTLYGRWVARKPIGK